MTGIIKTDQLQGAQGTTVTVPTGNTLAVTSNATVGGTLGVTGTLTTAAITSTGRHDVNFNGAGTQAFKYTDTGGGNLAAFGQFYNTSDALIGNIQNANNDGIHLNVKNGSIVFGNVGYTAANALDDFEEGTFTHAVSNFSTAISSGWTTGRYVKIGHTVWVHGVIVANSGNVTGTVAITGLPFTVIAGSQGYSVGMLNGNIATTTFGSSNINPVQRIDPNQTYIQTGVTSGTGGINLVYSGFYTT
tara:strand:+ start:447 stop:1184 length:738 start_codon:yes stop_codon:yes gene_type:complete